MPRAQVVSWWIGTGKPSSSGCPADPLRSHVSEYPGVTYCEDVTHQGRAQLIPAPNLVLVEIVCSQETLDALEGEPGYGAEAIIFAE